MNKFMSYINNDKRLKLQYTVTEVINHLKLNFNAKEHIITEEEKNNNMFYSKDWLKDGEKVKAIYKIDDAIKIDSLLTSKEKARKERFIKDSLNDPDYINEDECQKNLCENKLLYITIVSDDNIHFTKYRILGICEYIGEELLVKSIFVCKFPRVTLSYI